MEISLDKYRHSGQLSMDIVTKTIELRYDNIHACYNITLKWTCVNIKFCCINDS